MYTQCEIIERREQKVADRNDVAEARATVTRIHAFAPKRKTGTH
jgi:hypothetical protein